MTKQTINTMNNDWRKQFDEKFYSHFHTKDSDFYFTEADIKDFIQTLLDKQKEEVEEVLKVVYKNGLIDGKQNTNCEPVVVCEAIGLLTKLKGDKNV